VTGAVPGLPSATTQRVSVEEARARLLDREIAVPASAANLGPGFDTLAVALQIYLRVRVRDVDPVAANGMSFDLGGTRLVGENCIERGFRALAAEESLECPSIVVEVRSDIPLKGGLGSSAAATVAGLRLYECLTGPSDTRDLLTHATRIDGHADNVAAALLGGLTLSCTGDDGRTIARARRWPDAVRFVVASPAVHVSTPEARRVLPEHYTREDAVFNLQRAVLLVDALARGEFGLVCEMLRDRWHQPYRAAIVPGLSDALGLRHPHLLGVCLSGSGPTVLGLCTGAFDEIEQLFLDIYSRLGMLCTVRTVSAHQPAS
jgi:homoserine kinase